VLKEAEAANWSNAHVMIAPTYEEVDPAAKRPAIAYPLLLGVHIS